ncbi:hypothetical protein, partial [Achromobacter sp. Marseille-Q4962]|uniref:hypothetical protein n=1 Tax=Achromobacter sp. Marseille-Q4962 TaxID=2942202 RepID=UPI0020743E6F
MTALVAMANRVKPMGHRPINVSAGVILTHPVGVNLTHLGNDGGFLATDNVDSGASSGDQGNG